MEFSWSSCMRQLWDCKAKNLQPFQTISCWKSSMTKPTVDDDEGDRKSWLVHLSLRSQLFIAAAYSSSNEYLYQSLTEKKSW